MGLLSSVFELFVDHTSDLFAPLGDMGASNADADPGTAQGTILLLSPATPSFPYHLADVQQAF